MGESDNTESISVVETDSPAPASAPATTTTAPAASQPTASKDAPADDDKPVSDSADEPKGSDQQASEKPGDDAPAKPGRWEKRVNRLTAKLSELDREYTAERERAERAEARLHELEAQNVAAIEREPRPKAEDYDTVESFEDALVDWKLRQRTAADAKKSTSEPPAKADGPKQGEPAEPRKATDMEAAAYLAAKQKYSDLDQVFSDPSLPWSRHMADAVADLENSAEVLYHLGLDPDEMERIATLSPAAQIREVGKFADKLVAKLSSGTDTPAEPNPTPEQPATEPRTRQSPGVRITQAKPVPRPVAGSAPPSKSLDDMDQAEFEAHMNEQERQRARR